VCDAGGECELQDMTFKYGAAESKFMDMKNHREEQQWSPVVYFDDRAASCAIAAFGHVARHGCLGAGIQNRGSSSVIAPNKEIISSAKSAGCASTSACRRADLGSLSL